MGNIWSQINSLPVHDSFKLALISIVGTIFGFWGTNLFYYIIWRNSWLKQYKIQSRDPSPELVLKEVKENAIGLFTSIPLFSILFHKVFTIGKTRLKKSKSEKPEETGERNGWANFRVAGTAPTFQQYFLQIGLAYLLYDAMFYWSHRFLHRPAFFQSIHRVHHKFKSPIGVSASYSQLYESLTQLFMWWVPLGLSGYVFGDLHISTVYWYTIFRWIETCEAHSGYDLPFSPMKFLLLPAGARFHDYHHSHSNGNFGASKIWDWLMGTDQDYWAYKPPLSA